MRPIRVEFQAFGPYIGNEVVDFESLASKGLFLICGKIGTGKTMILDAMTFALYGKSSGNGRNSFESMRCTKADPKTVTFVRFDFENNGKYYRFERRLEPKKVKIHAIYNVAQKDENGVWQPLMENPKETDVSNEAEKIIGLKFEQFRQVIILPQGQFEKLLVSNSQEKETILTSIFGESKWQSIATAFFNNAEKCKKELESIDEKIKNSLREENCATLADLEAVIAGKEEIKKSLEDEYQKKDYDSLIKEQQDMLAVAKRFGDLDRARQKLDTFEARIEERNGWEKRLNNAKRAGKVRRCLEDEETAEKLLAQKESEEKKAKESAEEKKKLSEEAAQNLTLHMEKAASIEELKTKKIRYEGKREDYREIKEIEVKLETVKKEAESALKDEETAKNNNAALAQAVVDIKNEYDALNVEHGDYLNKYLAGITGELANKLEEGKPCPVCGSRSHPNKAKLSENNVTKEMVDEKKRASEEKYRELQSKTSEQTKAAKLVEEKHAALEKANTDVTTISTQLESKKKNLVEEIKSSAELEKKIREFEVSIQAYEDQKTLMETEDSKAREACVEAKTKVGEAEKATQEAKKNLEQAKEATEKGLLENQLSSREEARQIMLEDQEMEKLSSDIKDFDAGKEAAKENLTSLKEELKDKPRLEEEDCELKLNETLKDKGESEVKRATLQQELERLGKKANNIRREGNGLPERIKEAQDDYKFAKTLRGDFGTGFQRYVLGIMFSSVISAANNMLEMVHDGRYRLYRSDEKAQGSNKRGLELKVHDKYNEQHEGRFVNTLSGGEKFLVSLALSIGMSTVAQKSGIKMDALFIDEGFGTLDEESIDDAMDVLKSVQAANGTVGIISHVSLLQDQIPTKLWAKADKNGSHIVQTIG